MAQQEGIFTTFDDDDKVTSQISIVSSGMWSGGVGTLTSFYTSSTQSGSTGQHYLDAYNGIVGTNATASVQFSIAYGHYAGSGSKVGDSDYAASKAVYRQFRNLLLPQNEEYFQITGASGTMTQSLAVAAISMNRSRLKEKMDPGNWELHISASNGTTLKLIDDSGATSDPTVKKTTREFNVISGSISSGTAVSPSGETKYYGKFFPESGILVMDIPTLGSTATFAGFSTAATSVDANNVERIYHGISGSGYFASRREESIRSTHYFCRVKHNMYNHSQNPTYFTASTNELTVPSFRTDPQSYITTVGLYNDANELLAVAKLSRPILKSTSREALIKVRLDF